ncbi:MAG: bifunctional serine/threonine-protein kinase/formylglycine-generating enzyme family protein [Pseudomonadota bacterium]
MSDSLPENFQKHCPGCFRRKDNHPVCPHCGYDEAATRSPLFLPQGAVLAGQYRVGKVLGRPGGFGITYLGWDIYLQQKVAIKEYLPPDIAARIPESQDITVHTHDDRKSFETGKEQFLREARIVARLDHPNVVRVRGFFNANDTAYLVMDYYEGMSLDAYFGQVKPVLDPVIASSLMQMVLDGLDYVHRHGVVHRDMKPHNIYIAAVGKPIILDFGAARQAVAGSSPKSISVVLTEGYAPLEQYQRHGSQGPWTDVYGVAATLYRMIVGKSPPVVLDRIHRDQLEVDDFAGIPEALKPVLRKALALKIEERYQTASAFKLALAIALGPASSNAPLSDVSSAVKDMSQAEPSNEPLPNELLRDTTRRSSNGPSTSDAAVTRPQAEIAAAVAASMAAAPPLPYVPSPPSVPPPLPPSLSKPMPKPSARWQLPALGLVALLALSVLWLRETGEPAATTPTAKPAQASAQNAPAAQALPPLKAQDLPELSEVPAGVRRDIDYRALRMGRSEVTIGQFRRFVERSRYSNPAWATQGCEGVGEGSGFWDDPGYPQTDSHPVVCVDWDDAQRYAQWLSQETQRNFRLPTDREWEYAAAAGSTSRYWWGNGLTEANAVCADCSRQNPTKPWIVASLGANAWGLFGTASNVREWSCSALPEGNCAAPSQAGARITRGGSWRDPATALQTDFRASLDKGQRNTWTGFRVMEELP